jgi:hypothetical protein
MKVKVREWEGMKKQFGLDTDGDIPTDVCTHFDQLMAHLCGKEIEIEFTDMGQMIHYDEDGTQWTITDNMITRGIM